MIKLLIFVAAWFVGFLLLQLLTRLLLRHEPTAHGQIVGRQIGRIVGLFWPVALPALILWLGWHALREWWAAR
jgi:hypothetical protein